ncbi:MAG: hypothetical protein JXA33_22605 [Anaerolineae bacterium]|nr:hypothetical protein [Anaerolineae bacterium]
MQDTYWSEPQAAYEERRRLYLNYCAMHAPDTRFPGRLMNFFSQIARLELGLDVDEGSIRESIAFVDSRHDCCDFAVGGLLRILYRYHNSPHIAASLLDDIRACLLRFKYWWDEPAGDNHRCYHTENHQIIFHSDELLAGQLFPEQIFENNGQNGQYHIEHALHFIRRWFTFRIRFGFSEWLSNCYFDEDLLALVNLYDFAVQPDVRAQAGLLIDVLMFEMALHSYRGVFGCTHGRTYTRLIKGARENGSATTIKLMLGMGLYNTPQSLGAIPLATSNYRCPPIFEAIAADLDAPILCCERHSLNIEDALKHGLSYDSIEDGHLYWSIQDYVHPNIFALSQRMFQEYGVRLYEDYEARYQALYQWQIDEYGEIVAPNLECHAMTEVHIQTYRTPAYLLSCAQDYRPGKPGYQQHIWQATLGLDAMVFTNHPGAADEISRPNYWAGNGVMPRAAQHKNVLISVYHVSPKDAFPFSHAYFPRDAFDEVVEYEHWVCARKGTGFLALYSQHPYRWMPDQAGQIVEVRVDSPDNIWVCEMGDATQWSDFAAFVKAVSTTEVHCHGLDVQYISPSLGLVRFGWQGNFEVAGEIIALHDTPRFDNPYSQCAFLSPQIEIHRGEETLLLDFAPFYPC